MAAATAGIEGLALSVDVAPLVDVLKLLAIRVDELHADVKARDAAASEAMAKQQAQIDSLLARSAEVESAAREAAAAITAEDVVGGLLLDVLSNAVEIGERAVGRRERAELFARAATADERIGALHADAAALAERHAEAAGRSDAQFNSVRTDLSTLTEALEAVKACLLYTSPSPRD